MSFTTTFTNTFNVGTDLSLTITRNDTGAAVTLDGKKTDFRSKAKDRLIESQPIDNGGVPDHRVVAGGWSGSIAVDRATDDFAALFAFLEANYYAGGGQVYFTIVSTEPNANKSKTSRYLYSNCVFHGYDPGSWTKEAKVSATIDFDCAQRTKVQ
jgi:hypothetical protein